MKTLKEAGGRDSSVGMRAVGEGAWESCDSKISRLGPSAACLAPSDHFEEKVWLLKENFHANILQSIYYK